MSSEENKELSVREKGIIRMRSIMDLGMGIMWTAMGICAMFIKHINIDIAARYEPYTLMVFGIVCTIYGIFRIFRGVKKNYLKERGKEV